MDTLSLLLLLACTTLYLLPTVIAASANKRKTGAIFLLNLLLGWTLVAWIVSLVWAMADERADSRTSRREEPLEPPPPAPTPPPPTEPAQRVPPTPGQRVHLMSPAIVRVDARPCARSTNELRPGTDVTILRTSNDWAWVQTDTGEEGWIRL